MRQQTPQLGGTVEDVALNDVTVAASTVDRSNRTGTDRSADTGDRCRMSDSNQLLMMDKRTARKTFHVDFRNNIELYRTKELGLPNSTQVTPPTVATTATTKHNDDDDATESSKQKPAISSSPSSLMNVYIRKRPLLSHEVQTDTEFDVVTCYANNTNIVVHDCLMHWDMQHKYIDHCTYDQNNNGLFTQCFDETMSTQHVYDHTVKGLLQHASCRLNDNSKSVCMMYGQTGSGKSYTMDGFYHCLGKELFGPTTTTKDDDTGNSNSNVNVNVNVSLSMFEIVGTKIYDLLPTTNVSLPSALSIVSSGNNDENDDKEGNHNDNQTTTAKTKTNNIVDEKRTKKKSLKLCEDKNGCVQLVGIEQSRIPDYETFMKVLQQAATNRATESTTVNDVSSRSHSICRIRFTAKNDTNNNDGDYGELMLLDLAGSERNEDTKHHTKERIQESIEINKSHFALKQCILAKQKLLQQQQKRQEQPDVSSSSSSSSTSFIPYRSSVLTRVLKNSLFSEDAKAVVIATVSPISVDTEHTLSTLEYASKMTLATALSSNNNGISGDEKTSVAAPSVIREKREVIEMLSFHNNEIDDHTDDAVTVPRLKQYRQPGKKIRMWNHNDVVQWWTELENSNVHQYVRTSDDSNSSSSKIPKTVDGKQVLKWSRIRFQQVCNENADHGTYVYNELRKEIQKQNQYEKEQRELRKRHNRGIRD